MRLESALLASREGITAHGQAISVVGDNIANSSTTAFKQSRAEFDNLMAESAGDRGAGVVSGAGDGVAVGVIRTVFEGGLVESTGRDLDVAIQGGGFFLVGDPAAPQLSRAGAFQTNKDGFLVNGSGLKVLGYTPASPGTLVPINMFDVKTAGASTTSMKVFGNLSSSSPDVVVPQGAATFRDLTKNASMSATQEVYDSLGTRHDVFLTYFKTAANTWTVQAHVDGQDVGQTQGTPVLLGQTTLTFDGTGLIPAAGKAGSVITASPAWGNGAAAGNFKIDLSSFTQYAGASQVLNASQDGQPSGSVKSYEFGDDGTIYANLDSGTKAQVGSLPLATVRSVDGLVRSGSSVFSMGQNAGALEVGRANNGIRGRIEGKSLERSNVDISAQFVELVVFQRGYEANSNALSAANELIKGTIALLR
jgi:flagellar hook protein FlgE